MALHLLEKKSNQKLKYEELVVNELKKQLFTNSSCIQMNKKISELKSQNKEHVISILIKFIIINVNLTLFNNDFRS